MTHAEEGKRKASLRRIATGSIDLGCSVLSERAEEAVRLFSFVKFRSFLK
jgi:hypothetical protein